MKAYFLWLAKFITVLVVVFIFVPLLLGLVAGLANLAETSPAGSKTVAVLELTGLIDNSKDLLSDLYKQARDSNIKGIVVRVNSPGGAVGPSQEIYEAIKQVKKNKPVVVSMDAVAASGGLYAALGATKIFCNPGTMTGSIGVLMQVPNFSRIANWVGVDMVTIKAGRLKDVGNSFREMTEEERQFLERMAGDVQKQFINAVAESRNLPIEKVLSFADGRVLIGSEAKELGLVDAFGGLDDAARAVFEALNEPLPEGEYPKLYYPSEKFGALKKVLESAAGLPALFQRGIKLEYVMR